MIKGSNAKNCWYSSRDFAVIDLAIQILKYLSIEYSRGAGADGPCLIIAVEEARRFEREVVQWREAATQLVVT